MGQAEEPRGRRILRSMGLHPVAHRPTLTWRFWIYSVSAYLIPVVVHLALPAEGSSLDELVWLVILVPAFLLSLHYGLRGAFAALLLGTALMIGVEFSMVFTRTPGDPRITVPIYIAYGTLAISVGWLSQQLHEHYEYALDLQAAQKTEALGTMAAGIAHDFNNILTSMVANAELIAADDEDEGAKEQEMVQLKEAARRGAGMVRNMLGFSRKGMLALRPLDLAEIARGQMNLVHRLTDDTIEVRYDAEEDLPPVLADKDALERILVNLVTNARDAMPYGGTLVVEVTRGRLDREHRRRTGWGDPGEYVCLTVRDSGVGMDDRTQARIFEPFYTGKEPGEGVGLGMAMVYGLMKQHRGFVDVDSAPGAGTTVRTYFPVAKERVVREQAAPRRKPEGGSETILLVEDDESIRRAAQRILERFGYSVIIAADGEEAMERYRDHRREVDLVLSDVVLPKRSGPEFYAAIRRGPGEPPVLFTSGYPARTVHTKTDLDPTLPFLQKPWTVDELAMAVRETLDAAAKAGVGGPSGAVGEELGP